MLTLIIGKKSNLSEELSRKISRCILISSRDLITNIDLLLPFKETKINVIFNNFQPATALNDMENVSQYLENSIGITSKVLTYFKNTPIEKIIYTSSSSVYGNNILCNENDPLIPMNLHASLKMSNEKLIEAYCLHRNIDYTIARIFNMYGGNDQFSIISKIIRAVENNQSLTIINNGNAIRDFIHIDDVVDAYSHLLIANNIPYINIGSGTGTSIKNILLFLKSHHINVKTTTLQRDELKVSTANNAIMVKLLNKTKLQDVESYLLEKL